MRKEAVLLLIATFFLIGLSFVINMAAFAFQAWREKMRRNKKSIDALTNPPKVNHLDGTDRGGFGSSGV